MTEQKGMTNGHRFKGKGVVLGKPCPFGFFLDSVWHSFLPGTGQDLFWDEDLMIYYQTKEVREVLLWSALIQKE